MKAKVSDLQLLAMCNMLQNGRGFAVVQKPDYNGGHYHSIEPLGYECKNFEYVAWEGTPAKYVKERPTFTTHVEPFHSPVYELEYSAEELVQCYI